MKKSHLKKMLVFLCLMLAFMGVVFSAVKTGNANAESSAVYILEFGEQDNLGKNTSGSAAAADAEIITDNDGLTFQENVVKGKNAVTVTSKGNRKNYIKIPGSVLNNEAVTIAGWFKISSDINSWARMLEINKNAESSNSWVSVMPYAVNYYNGLHVNIGLDGNSLMVNNLDNWISEGADSSSFSNAPQAANILPVYDAWTHYAYEISPNGLKIYQNGYLIIEKTGQDLSANKFYGENAAILLGATNIDSTADFTGSYADIRVYPSALTVEQIVSEYQLVYADFLTASYDFEDGYKDSVRGYDGTAAGSASIAEDQSRNSNVLNLDGKQTDASNNSTRSSMDIPAKTVSGTTD